MQELMNLKIKPRTVLADVPFAFDNKATRASSNKHYAVLGLEELNEFKFPHDESGCLLLFWAWNAVLPECLEVIKAWSFTYKAIITWVKPHMGLGNYVRNATEHILLATKGKIRTKEPGKRMLSWFIAETRGHSRKPEYHYDIAEILGEPPYLELFSRRPRQGWISLGFEVEGKSPFGVQFEPWADELSSR